ncbi:MAG TPA: endonuclease/exonuclease/phosphatase family protein, partial [Polyangiaceae bacterium]|nr:endonuclease/exonuclease/phosphatase family protein [Polyangiaceae bacterium]
MKRWLLRALVVVGVAYPLCLAAIALAFRYRGEHWWMTGILLYLPRLVFAAPFPLVVGAAWWSRKPWLTAMQAFAAILIVFPLMGMVLPSPHGADAAAPVVRTLSYNVNSLYGGADRVLDEVDHFHPDVVLLQELSWIDVDRLKARLLATY